MEMAFHLELAAEAGTCTAGLPAFIPLSAATTLLGRGADGAAALTGLGDAVHVQLNHCPPAGCEWQQGIVSRQHARISVAGSAVTLTDVSANGTEVDGVGLARDAAAALRVGSVVVFGTRGPAASGASLSLARKKAFASTTFRYVLRAGPAPPAELAGAEAAEAEGEAGAAAAAAGPVPQGTPAAATPAAATPAAVTQALPSLGRYARAP